VTDTGTATLTNSIVEVQVFNSGGTAVSTNYASGQNFLGGQQQQYTYTWSVPTSQTTGTYTVMIGVFDSTWATDYYWNSNGATITVTAAQSAPAAPTQLVATAGNTQVALSWTAGSGAASYNLYRGTAAGGEGTTPVATGITTVTHTDTGLTNGTTYFYKVAAVNPGGTSPLSNQASAKPMSPCDVNQDGTLNVSDVQMIVDQALGIMSAANAMNHGGVTNVVEVQIVTNAVLGKTCSGT
jgi:hypothetical protein